MDAKTLLQMKRLWEQGVKIADIGAELGYSPHYVANVAQRYRDLFPYRKSTMRAKRHRDMWVARVVAGRASVAQAAAALGVHPYTINRWAQSMRESEEWQLTR